MMVVEQYAAALLEARTAFAALQASVVRRADAGELASTSTSPYHRALRAWYSAATTAAALERVRYSRPAPADCDACTTPACGTAACPLFGGRWS